MILRNSTLPNYCNGKVYKRWARVMNLFDDAILATKTDKRGNNIELLISPSERKRGLYTRDYAIVDTYGRDEVKRCYVYDSSSELTVGTMSTVKSDIEKSQPLVTFAKWFMNRSKLQEINLTLNPKHPKAKIKLDGEAVKPENFVTVSKIRATNIQNDGTPETLELTLSDNRVIKNKPKSIMELFLQNDDNCAEHPLHNLFDVV